MVKLLWLFNHGTEQHAMDWLFDQGTEQHAMDSAEAVLLAASRGSVDQQQPWPRVLLGQRNVCSACMTSSMA